MAIPTRDQIKRELLAFLRERGNVTPVEAYSYLALCFDLSSEDLALKRQGRSLFEHEVRWARQELTISGVIARPDVVGRGNWCLEKLRLPYEMPEQLLPHQTYAEGTVLTVRVNRYERSQKARQACITHYGAKCSVCDFNFAERYGPLGDGCIHVHHITPISEITENYEVDPEKDLRPVCPNCHYMLHR